MEYLKIFTDFARSVEPLDDAERGRLFMAMLAYADSGEEPALPGNERFVWPTARLHIDREKTFCEKQRERGVHGGRPKTRKNPEKPAQTQKDKDNDKDKDKDPSASPEGEASPRALGRYGNIVLSGSQLAQLKAEFPADWQERVDRLSEYVASSGKEYRNCLAVLRSWARKDAEEAGSGRGRPRSGGGARAAPDAEERKRDEWLKKCARELQERRDRDDWMKEYIHPRRAETAGENGSPQPACEAAAP